MNYRIYILNYNSYSNKKYSKFTLNYLDDQDFSNFMRGIDKEGTGQRVYGSLIYIIIKNNLILTLKFWSIKYLFDFLIWSHSHGIIPLFNVHNSSLLMIIVLIFQFHPSWISIGY